jgi:hypothetical protein
MRLLFAGRSSKLIMSMFRQRREFAMELFSNSVGPSGTVMPYDR